MNNYVSKIVNNRWKMGIPTTMGILQTQLTCHLNTHIQKPNHKLFSKVYLEVDPKNILKRSL